MNPGVEARSIVAEMEQGFLEPVRLRDLRGQWRAHVAALPVYEGEDTGIRLAAGLRDFLEGFVEARMDEVGALVILRTLTPALDAMRSVPEIAAREVVRAAASCFATDPIDTSQIVGTTLAAYDRMQETRDTRDTISRALVLCRRAADVLESVDKAVAQLILDRDVVPAAFKTVADRERFANVVLVDVRTERNYLDSTRAELVLLDERMTHTREELIRALVALTMFKDLGKLDQNAGFRNMGAAPNVGRPVSFGSGNSQGRTVMRHDG